MANLSDFQDRTRAVHQRLVQLKEGL